MKNRVFVIALVIGSLLVCFIVAEVAVRIALPSRMKVIKLNKYRESERAKFAKYDKLLGWSGLARADDDFLWADVKHRVRQNSFGYRGGNYAYERSDKRRLLVLGDSFVWGFGVENEELFTSVMEKEKNGKIEVVNAGVSGYGTDQELLLWRKEAHKWKPDHVLLMVTLTNDLLDVSSSARYGYSKPFFTLKAGELQLKNVPVPKSERPWKRAPTKVGIQENRTLKWILDRSAVMNLFVEVAADIPTANRWLVKRGVTSRKQLSHIWDDKEYLVYMLKPNKEAQRAWKIFFALIKEMEKSVRSSGADFTVVLIPPIHYVYPELWKDYLKNPYIPKGIWLSFAEPGRRVSEWCAENKIDVIDLTPHLVGIEGSYFPINRHWTALGHKKVALTLLDQLK